MDNSPKELEFFLSIIGYSKLTPNFADISFDQFLQLDYSALSFLDQKQAAHIENNINILKQIISNDNSTEKDLFCLILECTFDIPGNALTVETALKFGSHGVGLARKEPKKSTLAGVYGMEKRINFIDTSIDQLTNIKHLYLSNNRLQTMISLNLPLLTVLEVDGNFLRKIEGLDKCTFLEQLNLSKNFISCLENLKNQTKLESLNISHQQTYQVKEFKIDVESLPYEGNSLRVLNLDSAGLIDATGLMLFSSLRQLKLANNLVAEMGGVLAMLESLTLLQELNVLGNPFTMIYKNWRDLVILKNPSLAELNGKKVTLNEKSYVPQLYMRKTEKKKSTKKEVEELEVLGTKMSIQEEKVSRRKFGNINY